MADRGKVLLGLKQHLLAPNVDECVGCPYGDLFGLDCERQLYRDAVELLKEQLKEQEPRVLTWDEVTALPNGEENEVAVVQEQKVPVGTFDNGSICQWRGARFVQERDHYYYNEETYGTTWRCWTALPTKKQRKAVKWK